MFTQSDLPQITWAGSQEALFSWTAKVENQKGVETRNIFVWSYKVIYLLVISCYTTQSVLKVVYNSVIHPYLNYSIFSLGRASNAKIQPQLQNKAIKIIRTTNTASLEELFQNLNIFMPSQTLCFISRQIHAILLQQTASKQFRWLFYSTK